MQGRAWMHQEAQHYDATAALLSPSSLLFLPKKQVASASNLMLRLNENLLVPVPVSHI